MIDLTLWSVSLNDDLKLKQISMPGSHDATIYDGGDFNQTGFTQYVVSKKRSITQSGSIADQCRTGSRFFDVRLKESGGVVRCYHETAGQGGVGATSQKILDDVNGFLDALRQELEQAINEFVARIKRDGRLEAAARRHGLGGIAQHGGLAALRGGRCRQVAVVAQLDVLRAVEVDLE